MKIVIDIPKEEYDEILSSEDCGLHTLTRAVVNGTPLPKGHGRLIDADALIEHMNNRMEVLRDDESIWESSSVETAINMFAPIVIEADGGDENGNG